MSDLVSAGPSSLPMGPSWVMKEVFGHDGNDEGSLEGERMEGKGKGKERSAEEEERLDCRDSESGLASTEKKLVRSSCLPTDMDFHHQHTKGNDQNGSSNEAHGHPGQSVVLSERAARVGLVTIAGTNQKQRKVGQMTGFTAPKVVFLHVGEALIFASPFVLDLVKEAQAHFVALLCDVGSGETDGQLRVQASDRTSIFIHQSDVQNATEQPLVRGVGGDVLSAAHVGDNQRSIEN